MAAAISATGFKGLSWGSSLAGEDCTKLSSVPTMVRVTKPIRSQPMMKNVNEGKGLFAPLVVVTRNLIGRKRFNQLRGKAIALHSQDKYGIIYPTASFEGKYYLRPHKHVFTHLSWNTFGLLSPYISHLFLRFLSPTLSSSLTFDNSLRLSPFRTAPLPIASSLSLTHTPTSSFGDNYKLSVITEFCKSIGADGKQRQGLIRLAKKNGERLGFLA